MTPAGRKRMVKLVLGFSCLCLGFATVSYAGCWYFERCGLPPEVALLVYPPLVGALGYFLGHRYFWRIT